MASASSRSARRRQFSAWFSETHESKLLLGGVVFVVIALATLNIALLVAAIVMLLLGHVSYRRWQIRNASRFTSDGVDDDELS